MLIGSGHSAASALRPIIKHSIDSREHRVGTSRMVALDGSRIKPTLFRQISYFSEPAMGSSSSSSSYRARRLKRQFMPGMSDARSMSQTIQGPGGMSMSGSMSQAMAIGQGGMSEANAGAMAMSGMGMSQAMSNANAMSMG